jgi:hypothetical protein
LRQAFSLSHQIGESFLTRSSLLLLSVEIPAFPKAETTRSTKTVLFRPLARERRKGGWQQLNTKAVAKIYNQPLR